MAWREANGTHVNLELPSAPHEFQINKPLPSIDMKTIFYRGLFWNIEGRSSNGDGTSFRRLGTLWTRWTMWHCGVLARYEYDLRNTLHTFYNKTLDWCSHLCLPFPQCLKKIWLAMCCSMTQSWLTMSKPVFLMRSMRWMRHSSITAYILHYHVLCKIRAFTLTTTKSTKRWKQACKSFEDKRNKACLDVLEKR